MEELMEAIVERCAGLDVHQATVVACLNIGTAGAKPNKAVRTFGTTLPDLEDLRDWLKTHDCTLVAMESTGIYWRPVHAVLEDHFELVVGNAHHILGHAAGAGRGHTIPRRDGTTGARADAAQAVRVGAGVERPAGR